MRIVKRYSNRKLYCTKNSRYVTLGEICEELRDEKIKVVCNKTNEDITRITKARAIFKSQLEELKNE